MCKSLDASCFGHHWPVIDALAIMVKVQVPKVQYICTVGIFHNHNLCNPGSYSLDKLDL